MAASAGLSATAGIVPVFIDADATPNPGGFPIGGVTLIDLPNSHLQYAVTWYGLAAALAASWALRSGGGAAREEARPYLRPLREKANSSALLAPLRAELQPAFDICTCEIAESLNDGLARRITALRETLQRCAVNARHKRPKFRVTLRVESGRDQAPRISARRSQTAGRRVLRGVLIRQASRCACREADRWPEIALGARDMSH